MFAAGIAIAFVYVDLTVFANNAWHTDALISRD